MGSSEQVRPMLAAKWEDSKPLISQHLAEDGFLWMQPKIDGMRVCFDDGVARSRSWKPHSNTYLQQFAKDYKHSLFGLDGEVVSGLSYTGNSFRESMSGIRAEDGSRDFTIFCFDMWAKPYALGPYNGRLRAVNVTVDALNSAIYNEPNARTQYRALVLACPTIKVTSWEEIERLEAKFISEGWEGAILRRNEPAYKYNRATAKQGQLMKIKRFIDEEATVYDYEPWYENQNEATLNELGYTTRTSHQDNLVALPRLGALHVRLNANPEVTFKIGVFRGLSHADRDTLWEQRESLIGRICTFSHQGYDGGYDKPRTPVWLRWRDPSDT